MQNLAVSLANRRIAITRADGTVIDSDCAGGDAFTATELLAAALGSCMAASIEPLLARHGTDSSELRIALRLLGETLAQGFDATILLPHASEDLVLRCQRAVDACPVRRALGVPLDIQWQQN